MVRGPFVQTFHVELKHESSLVYWQQKFPINSMTVNVGREGSVIQKGCNAPEILPCAS